MKYLNQIKKHSILILCLGFIISNLAGLFLLRQDRQKKTISGNYISWDNQLTQQGFSPTIIKEIKILDQAFPDEQGIFQFMDSINRYKDHFDKLSLNFEAEEPKFDKFKYLPFILQITGPTEKVTDFITRIWNSPYLIETTALEITHKPDTRDKVEAKLKARLYILETFGEK